MYVYILFADVLFFFFAFVFAEKLWKLFYVIFFICSMSNRDKAIFIPCLEFCFTYAERKPSEIVSPLVFASTE